MKKHHSLQDLAAYAKRHGFKVEIKSDHIVAANNHGTVRTASMETLRKIAGGAR